jgi:hypothetical protein
MIITNKKKTESYHILRKKVYETIHAFGLNQRNLYSQAIII